MAAYIEFLGTGSAFNFTDGNLSAAVVSRDALDDSKVDVALLDCGFDVPKFLTRAGLTTAVNRVLISHMHDDHVGGLGTLAFMRYFIGQNMGVKVPSLEVPSDILPLIREATRANLSAIQDDFGRPVGAGLETYFDVRRYTQPIPCGDLQIRYVPIRHVKHAHEIFPSYAYEIYDARSGAMTFYTADTCEVQRNPSAEQARLVFHDCQLFTGKNNGAGDVHVSLDRLIAEYPEEWRAKTWLMHYGEKWMESSDKALQAGFAGFVRPGMRFDLASGKLVNPD